MEILNKQFHNGEVLYDTDLNELVEQGNSIINYIKSKENSWSQGGESTTQSEVAGPFKNRVFTRTNIDISNIRPSGGDYDNPTPNNTAVNNTTIIWSDGVPSGSESIWSTVCTFYGDGSSTGWSLPTKEVDTSDLDIEFSQSSTQPNAPEGNIPFSNHISEGWYSPEYQENVDWTAMIWRAERKVKNGVYQGNWVISRIKGEKGEDGKDGDGYSIIINPNYVIFSEELNSQNNSVTVDLSQEITIEVLKENIAQQFSLTYGTHSNCILNTAQGQSTSANTLVSKAIIKFGSLSDINGYLVVNITTSDNEFSKSNIKIPFYLNKFGTFQRTIINGVETAIGNKVGYDNGDGTYTAPTETSWMYHEINDATQHIRTIEQRVAGSKNLFTGANDIEYWNSQNCTIVFDPIEKSFSIKNITSTPAVVYSNPIKIEKGQDYTVSYGYEQENPIASNQVKVFYGNNYQDTISYIAANNYEENINYSFPIVWDRNLEALRNYGLIDKNFSQMAGSGDIWVSFVVYYTQSTSDTVFLFDKPQIEPGTYMTSWEEPNSSYVTQSQIRQVSDEINLSIKQGLSETGIDITNKEIKLKADKVNFYNSAGTELNPKIHINTTTGTLYAENGEFEGTVRATNLYHSICIVNDGGTCSEKWKCNTSNYTYHQSNSLGENDVSCTGPADIIILVGTNSSAWTYNAEQGKGTIYIPRPQDYQGKYIEIYHKLSGEGSDSARIACVDKNSHFILGFIYSSSSSNFTYSGYTYNEITLSYNYTMKLLSVESGNSWYWLVVENKSGV